MQNKLTLGIKLCLLLALSFSSSACTQKVDGNESERDTFQEAIIDEVLAHTQLYEVPRDVITVIKEEHGSFSSPDSNETLVICALDYDGQCSDEKAFVLLDNKSNKCICYYESFAEYNDYVLLPYADNTYKLMNIKTHCYTGIYNQEFEFVDFTNPSAPVSFIYFDEVPEGSEDTFGYTYDNTSILLAKGKNFLVPEEIVGHYTWNVFESKYGKTKEVYGLN